MPAFARKYAEVVPMTPEPRITTFILFLLDTEY
jgi:hypothetical protein